MGEESKNIQKLGTKNKIYSVRVKDERLQKFLDNQDSFQEFAINIFQKVLTGKLIDESQLPAKIESMRLKNLKTKLEIYQLMKQAGFLLPDFQQALSDGLPKLELKMLESKFNEVVPDLNEWTHFCKSTGRDVTFPKDKMKECYMCGESYSNGN